MGEGTREGLGGGWQQAAELDTCADMLGHPLVRYAKIHMPCSTCLQLTSYLGTAALEGGLGCRRLTLED